MGQIVDRTLQDIENRRNNLLEGGINSIPTPFKRYEEDLLGIEQATYYCVTATTKGGKSQFMSNFFIYNSIFYAYNNPDKLDLKIFYFNLEETPERVTQRFMSFLLFKLSKGKIRISPKQLRSSINTQIFSEEILNLLKSDEYTKYLDFFEECIIFSSTQNPTGIYKECKKYAEEVGETFYEEYDTEDDFGNIITKKKFSHYIPNNPKEYKLVVIDHISIIDTERGWTLKQSMDKLSEYLAKYLRNRYGFSPVVVQQQNFDGEGNDAFKLGRLRPTKAGLGDSKYISRDCNVLLGLFSPITADLREYEGYDITKFRDGIRFLEVLANRDGEMGGLCPLFFDGATCQFNELPLPTDKAALQQVYNYIESIRGRKTNKSFFSKSIKTIKNYLRNG